MTPASPKNLPTVTDVLVVGCGTSGLSTALSLRVQGVDVVIVDGATGPGIGSRAAVVHAASLEEMNTLGLANLMINEGIPSNEFAFRDDENRSLMTIDFSMLKDVTDYPMILLIAQDVVERIMVERLAELGVRTVFNKTVVHIRDVPGEATGENSRLACSFASGETIIARTIVGADGSRSLVRQSAGIRYYDPHTKLEPTPTTGKDVVQLVLADVLISGPLPATFPTDRPITTFGTDGMIMLYPLKNPPDSPRGTFFFRFVCSLMPEDPEPPSVPSVAYVQRLLDARGPGSRLGKPMPRVVQVLAGSRYRTRSAIAEDFCSLPPRHGRTGAIALVGDAAHIHSPSGGQGMNLSICDGVRLGRALAVGTRYALSAYARDRRAAAHRGIELSERLMEFANVRGSWAQGIRNAAMRTMMKFQGKQRSFALRMSGLTDPNDLWTW